MNFYIPSNLSNKLVSNKLTIGRLTAVALTWGGALAVIAPLPATAQNNAPDCPSIFYREPFTSRVSASVGCPPTEYQQSQEQFQTAAPVVPNSALDPAAENIRVPLPESRSDAIASVSPVDNQLTISLMNNTGATVIYEVIGDTQRRELMPDESTMLQDIPLPSTITLVRPDAGLLDITAASTEAGMLQLSLSVETMLDNTQGVVRIQPDGQVFVN